MSGTCFSTEPMFSSGLFPPGSRKPTIRAWLPTSDPHPQAHSELVYPLPCAKETWSQTLRPPPASQRCLGVQGASIKRATEGGRIQDPPRPPAHLSSPPGFVLLFTTKLTIRILKPKNLRIRMAPMRAWWTVLLKAPFSTHLGSLCSRRGTPSLLTRIQSP